MNERIKELVKEHYCRTEYDNGSVHECYEFSPDELEKFTEMIIGECATIALWEQGKGHDVGELIKQHFGVE